MGFLRNCWYLACWSDELEEAGRLSRTIIGEPMLIWRSGAELFATADRCPHRMAPLHLGQIDGATVRCAYHGLQFSGATGRCIYNPHGATTGAMSVRAYPVVERHHAIWLWPGDAASANVSEIPDLGFIDRAVDTAMSKGYMLTFAGHELLEDNILDLSHTDYLHPNTLGGGSLTRSKAQVDDRGNTLFVRWLANDEVAIPIFAGELPEPNGRADMWTEVLWQPNGVMILTAGATNAGRPRDEGVDTSNVHAMTPETATTTHYFFCNVRDYRTHDAAYNQRMAAALREVFEGEDKPMVEAQQRALGETDLFDHELRLLNIDNASTRARRIYKRLASAENATSSSVP